MRCRRICIPPRSAALPPRHAPPHPPPHTHRGAFAPTRRAAPPSNTVYPPTVRLTVTYHRYCCRYLPLPFCPATCAGPPPQFVGLVQRAWWMCYPRLTLTAHGWPLPLMNGSLVDGLRPAGGGRLRAVATHPHRPDALTRTAALGHRADAYRGSGGATTLRTGACTSFPTAHHPSPPRSHHLPAYLHQHHTLSYRGFFCHCLLLQDGPSGYVASPDPVWFSGVR